ncbi:MAG TPA: CAP-associated domain-containing protein, partial [Bacillales bacterium]|nr:CAP-associated domain-containing protein [Bacillales bacterium]
MGKITRFVMTWAVIVLISVFLYNHFHKTSPIQPEKPSKQMDQQNHSKQLKGSGNGLQAFIGVKSERIKKKFGKPQRISPSAYGYDWWVYNKDEASYMQVGIKDGKVVTLFAFGRNLNTGSLPINGKRTDVLKGIQLDHMVSLKVEGNDYKFQLKDDDVKAKPLIRVGNDWAILYFDTFTNRLAGIRYLDGKTLVTLRPYSLTYRGELFQQKHLNRDQWEAV